MICDMYEYMIIRCFLITITWTIDPVAFTLPFIEKEIRWYGIIFSLGFAIGVWIIQTIWKQEKLNKKWFDQLFLYVIFSSTIGARLGHCLFYAPNHYLAHSLDIVKIWEGGLSSHGGAMGIIIAVWIYSKKITKKSMLWTLDRLIIPVGFTGALIRLGNMTNHEIYGHMTCMPWGFHFITNLSYIQSGTVPIFTPSSHPTQLYEAFFYILTSCFCLWMYWKRKNHLYSGLIFGSSLIGIFLSRFLIEFFKNIQETFEEKLFLNMGQLLSIPFILMGIWFTYNGLRIKSRFSKSFHNVLSVNSPNI